MFLTSTLPSINGPNATVEQAVTCVPTTPYRSVYDSKDHSHPPPQHT